MSTKINMTEFPRIRDFASIFSCRFCICIHVFPGNSYYFICEKWLAVEEQDGKVEREFMALEGPLEFTKVGYQ